MSHDADEARRQFLIQALALGLFAATPLARAGQVPRQMPAGKSIYSLQGSLLVNGVVANLDTVISPNDKLVTGDNSQAIFVVGHDAFTLRANSELQLSSHEQLVGGLRLVAGALLSVFGKSRHQIDTPTSTIGIRGTGVYVEAQPDVSYVCTCYGTTEIKSSNGTTESVTSQHHDAPKYVTNKGEILPAGFFNHTDDELLLIETLVGRTTPFALFDDSYGGPKRY
ncbi:MAG: FecR domain-containing protein [Methylophilaceae bacterium]